VRRCAFVAALALLTGVLLAPPVAAAQALPKTPGVLFLPEATTTLNTPRVIFGTAGPDIITIGQNVDGSLTVTVNQRPQTVAATDVPRLVIDGGAGNDVITVDADVSAGVTIFGGAGNDLIDDQGSGSAFIDGGPGSDTINGGSGYDLLFGGAGNDRLTLRGSSGLMAGGPGSDTYSGGSSSARIFARRNAKITSPGHVTFVSFGAKDASGHTPGYVVQVTGSTSYRQQVTSELTSLLSLPDGRRLLSALDSAGQAVSITQTAGGNETTILDPATAFLGAGGVHGAASATVISYNPYETTIEGGRQTWQSRPPIVGLYHELVHALNAATGTMQPGKTASGVLKLEYQAVGLPFKGIPFRWSPTAPLDLGNPPVFTENGLRSLLGIARRTAY
jgi:Effector protein/RTX calcium-binding nonapeptide repeat (4 copies)